MAYISKRILRRAQKDDEEALREVIKKVEGMIYKFAKMCPVESHMIKDVKGVLITKVWHTLKRYKIKKKGEKGANFSTYLYTALLNYVNSECRRYVKAMGKINVSDFEINSSGDLDRFRHGKAKIERLGDESVEGYFRSVLSKEELLERLRNDEVIKYLEYRDYIRVLAKYFRAKAKKDENWILALKVFREKIKPSKVTIKIAIKNSEKKGKNNIRITNRDIGNSLGVSKMTIQNVLRYKIKPIVEKVLYGDK